MTIVLGGTPGASLRRLAVAALPLFFGIDATPAFSYPQFISYGYQSCLSCHYNPLGNGPLTSYGRALSAMELSHGLFDGRDDEKKAAASGFPVGLPDFLALQANYRGMYLGTGVQKQTISTWINMQLEGSVVVGRQDSVFASVTAGYVPPPRAFTAKQRQQSNKFISREHYLGVQLKKNWGAYVGFFDAAFGIRVPEHSSFIRRNALLNINDQTHGVMTHFSGDFGEGAIHLMMGNLYQAPSVRPVGGSAYIEFNSRSQSRLGGSLWYTTSEFRKRQMAALHGRFVLAKGAALLVQTTLVRQKAKGSDTWALGDLIFVQGSFPVSRGLNLLFTFEHAVEDFSPAWAHAVRVGPALQYFPWHRLELRTDFQASRNFGASQTEPDNYSVMGQVHVWL